MTVIATRPGYSFKPQGDLPPVTPEGVEVDDDQFEAVVDQMGRNGIPYLTLEHVGGPRVGGSRTVEQHNARKRGIHGIRQGGSLVHYKKGRLVDAGNGIRVVGGSTGLVDISVNFAGELVVTEVPAEEQ